MFGKSLCLLSPKTLSPKTACRCNEWSTVRTCCTTCFAGRYTSYWMTVFFIIITTFLRIFCNLITVLFFSFLDVIPFIIIGTCITVIGINNWSSGFRTGAAGYGTRLPCITVIINFVTLILGTIFRWIFRNVFTIFRFIFFG